MDLFCFSEIMNSRIHEKDDEVMSETEQEGLEVITSWEVWLVCRLGITALATSDLQMYLRTGRCSHHAALRVLKRPSAVLKKPPKQCKR